MVRYRRSGTCFTLMRAAAVAVCGVAPLPAAGALQLSPDGITVYDTTNNVSWLADANLAASNRFGLPLCSASSTPCVNASGSMNYPSAAAWVNAMNAANYLGHNDWQLPTTPFNDSTCAKKGTNGGSFGFNCTSSALASLYYNALGLKAPNTAVPIPSNSAGPFLNLQPYLYWSQMSEGSSGYATFSFNNGWVGANVGPNFLYVLPMIAGKIPGTVAATGNGLEVNSGGQTIYDPVANITWLANANLAATNTFGLPICTDPTTPAICVNQDGSMTWNSANQFIANMNAYNGSGYLGQKNWALPPIDPSCSGYNCSSASNPMGELFYGQFGLTQGTPLVATPDVAVGPFHNIQPYLYWSCQGGTVQGPCDTAVPAPNFEWSFTFGSGFLGTDVLQNDLYVTAYFAGTPSLATGPVIAEVANAEGDAPTIAPNTWVEIKGANLAPANDSRIWLASDFVSGNMPTQLDGVSATVNGKSAYVWYISSNQVNILTPPNAMNGAVNVILTNNGAVSATFTAQAQTISPSFFVFDGTHIAATHLSGAFIGPATLYPGQSTPAKPGETVVIYANGFGSTSAAVVSGSPVQSGTLSPLPTVKIGGISATVGFAGLVAPGEFQFNVTIPNSLGNGDEPIVATYGGASTQAGAVITIHN